VNVSKVLVVQRRGPNRMNRARKGRSFHRYQCLNLLIRNNLLFEVEDPYEKRHFPYYEANEETIVEIEK